MTEAEQQIVEMLNQMVRHEDNQAAVDLKLRGWHTIRASAFHEALNAILAGRHRT